MQQPVQLKSWLQQRALELGFDECRITTAAPPETGPHLTTFISEGHHGDMAWIVRNAHKRLDPRQILPEAQSLVVLAVSYHHPDSDQTPPQIPGLIARYARHADYHNILGKALATLSSELDAIAQPSSRSLWYVDTGPILERDLAQRAGIGFAGKHTNLISRSLGNWFFLAEILTAVAIDPDPPEKNHCGRCTRCITACPTAAITAPFTLDARRCISYLTIELKGSMPQELRPLVGNRIYGCDDCLAACPWNRFAREGSLMSPHARQDLGLVDLLELLAIDDDAFKVRFAGTPMLRTKRRGLLRNVCVALGNIGDRSVLPALEKASWDPEPLIAEHARWAIVQIEARPVP